LTKELAPKFRIRLYKEIHEIVFHGGGGYTPEYVMDMPIWHRKFIYNEIADFFKKKNEAAKGESSDHTAIGSDGLVKNKQIFKSKIPSTKFTPNQGGPKRSPSYK
jgi:hypothetical protein